MPHDPKFDADFRCYPTKRAAVLRQLRELRCYYKQLEQVVKAMPGDAPSAGYMDLDNVEQLQADLGEAIEALDWDSLDMEFCRLGLPTEVKA